MGHLGTYSTYPTLSYVHHMLVRRYEYNNVGRQLAYIRSVRSSRAQSPVSELPQSTDHSRTTVASLALDLHTVQ